MENKSVTGILQKYAIYVVLAVLFIACSLISPYFLQSSNLINVTTFYSTHIWGRSKDKSYRGMVAGKKLYKI